MNDCSVKLEQNNTINKAKDKTKLSKMTVIVMLIIDEAGMQPMIYHTFELLLIGRLMPEFDL